MRLITPEHARAQIETADSLGRALLLAHEQYGVRLFGRTRLDDATPRVDIHGFCLPSEPYRELRSHEIPGSGNLLDHVGAALSAHHDAIELLKGLTVEASIHHFSGVYSLKELLALPDAATEEQARAIRNHVHTRMSSEPQEGFSYTILPESGSRVFGLVQIQQPQKANAEALSDWLTTYRALDLESLMD